MTRQLIIFFSNQKAIDYIKNATILSEKEMKLIKEKEINLECSLEKEVLEQARIMAISYQNLANQYELFKFPQQALQSYKKSYQICQEYFGAGHYLTQEFGQRFQTFQSGISNSTLQYGHQDTKKNIKEMAKVSNEIENLQKRPKVNQLRVKSAKNLASVKSTSQLRIMSANPYTKGQLIKASSDQDDLENYVPIQQIFKDINNIQLSSKSNAQTHVKQNTVKNLIKFSKQSSLKSLLSQRSVSQKKLDQKQLFLKQKLIQKQNQLKKNFEFHLSKLRQNATDHSKFYNQLNYTDNIQKLHQQLYENYRNYDRQLKESFTQQMQQLEGEFHKIVKQQNQTSYQTDTRLFKQNSQKYLLKNQKNELQILIDQKQDEQLKPKMKFKQSIQSDQYHDFFEKKSTAIPKFGNYVIKNNSLQIEKKIQHQRQQHHNKIIKMVQKIQKFVRLVQYESSMMNQTYLKMIICHEPYYIKKYEKGECKGQLRIYYDSLHESIVIFFKKTKPQYKLFFHFVNVKDILTLHQDGTIVEYLENQMINLLLRKLVLYKDLRLSFINNEQNRNKYYYKFEPIQLSESISLYYLNPLQTKANFQKQVLNMFEDQQEKQSNQINKLNKIYFEIYEQEQQENEQCEELQQQSQEQNTDDKVNDAYEIQIDQKQNVEEDDIIQNIDDDEKQVEFNNDLMAICQQRDDKISEEDYIYDENENIQKDQTIIDKNLEEFNDDIIKEKNDFSIDNEDFQFELRQQYIKNLYQYALQILNNECELKNEDFIHDIIEVDEQSENDANQIDDVQNLTNEYVKHIQNLCKNFENTSDQMQDQIEQDQIDESLVYDLGTQIYTRDGFEEIIQEYMKGLKQFEMDSMQGNFQLPIEYQNLKNLFIQLHYNYDLGQLAIRCEQLNIPTEIWKIDSQKQEIIIKNKNKILNFSIFNNQQQKPIIFMFSDKTLEKIIYIQQIFRKKMAKNYLFHKQNYMIIIGDIEQIQNRRLELRIKNKITQYSESSFIYDPMLSFLEIKIKSQSKIKNYINQLIQVDSSNNLCFDSFKIKNPFFLQSKHITFDKISYILESLYDPVYNKILIRAQNQIFKKITTISLKKVKIMENSNRFLNQSIVIPVQDQILYIFDDDNFENEQYDDVKLSFKIDFKQVYGFKVNVRILSVQDIVIFVIESYKKRLNSHLQIYSLKETNNRNLIDLIKIFKINLINHIFELQNENNIAFNNEFLDKLGFSFYQFKDYNNKISQKLLNSIQQKSLNSKNKIDKVEYQTKDQKILSNQAATKIQRKFKKHIQNKKLYIKGIQDNNQYIQSAQLIQTFYKSKSVSRLSQSDRSFNSPKRFQSPKQIKFSVQTVKSSENIQKMNAVQIQ